MTPRPAAQKSTRTPGQASATSEGFSAEERAAMRERAQELRASARHKSKVDGESALLAQIASMEEPDRTMAQRLHAIIKKTAPELTSRTWYGMPAYAKDGNVICFFRNATKFKNRYATLGFSDAAHLDQGAMWPTDFALTALTDKEEAEIVALLRRALS